MTLCRHEINVTWIIENYLLYSDRYHKEELGISYSYTDDKENTMFICIDPKGIKTDSEDYVSFLSVFNETELKNKLLDVNVIFFNSDNEVIVEFDEKQGTDFEEATKENLWTGLGFSKVLTTKELENQIKASTNDTLIVRCRFIYEKNSDATNLTKINKTYKTTIDFDKFSFKWCDESDIPPFQQFKKVTKLAYESPFEISVKSPEDDILIAIKRNENIAGNMYPKVKCQVFLMKDSTEKLSKCDFFDYDNNTIENDIWHFPSFIKKSFLNDNRSEETWTLKIDLFVSNGIVLSKSIEDTKILDSKTLIKASDISVIVSLQNDLHDMLSSKKYTDVKLLISKEVLNAHKIILASRSPVFSAMFDQEMTEGQTGTVNISDIDPDTMKLFLKFLYTGKLDEVDCERLLELLLVAEKYQVMSLKEKCCGILTLRLNTDNICEIVSVADMVGHAILKTAAMKYIKENAAEILSSPKWSEWIVKNVRLGSEILCKFSDIIKTSN